MNSAADLFGVCSVLRRADQSAQYRVDKISEKVKSLERSMALIEYDARVDASQQILQSEQRESATLDT